LGLQTIFVVAHALNIFRRASRIQNLGVPLF